MRMNLSWKFDWDLSNNSRERNGCDNSDVKGNHLGVPSNVTSKIDLVVLETKNDNLISSVNDQDNLICSSNIHGDEGRNPLHFMEPGEISLRKWLDNPDRVVDPFECLHIFRQVVETVNSAHSQGIVVHNIRPSFFVMSSFNSISFIKSSSCSSSSSDSVHDESSRRKVTQASKTLESTLDSEGFGYSKMHVRRPGMENMNNKKIAKGSKVEENGERKAFPLKQILAMEVSWYTSPEAEKSGSSGLSSDIYCLGIFLFELFYTFSSFNEKIRTMINLRHRVLPPQLLLKWPKEASFCLWLLHPQSNARPKISEVLQSDFLNEHENSYEEREAAVKLKEDIEEHELLLEFLKEMQETKQDMECFLHDTISVLSSDIREVLKYQLILKKKASLYIGLNRQECLPLENSDQKSSYPVRDEDSINLNPRKRLKADFCDQNEVEFTGIDAQTFNKENIMSKNSQLMKNFNKLEAAYFSTRCKVLKPREKIPYRTSQVNSTGRSSLRTEGSSVDNFPSKEVVSEDRKIGWIDPFLVGLCKYLSFSKLKVRADLRQSDLLNSSNLVCSMGFDRDKDFLAIAGVNKKIKVFECDAILSQDDEIRYPVLEMSSRSKLSSICWNGYIKSQIASSDFEGVIQVWDTTRGSVFVEMKEHERRAWSVDFSPTDPTKFASGSDDGTIKLWNINQARSTSTMKTKANVCCVNFSPVSSHYLAVSSADHKIYCYDLRNIAAPLATLVGHKKTVSYVKFIDSTTLVSSSTDNSLKLWDLKKNASFALDNPVQTFTGHTNIKNFVGLSVYDGYIATGSETNEVFVYHKAFPMPVLSFKFNSKDPLSGREIEDSSQFISSVCWRGKSSTLVAANSTGNIKILEMI